MQSKSGNELDKPKKDTLIVPVKRTEKEAKERRPLSTSLIPGAKPDRDLQ